MILVLVDPIGWTVQSGGVKGGGGSVIDWATLSTLRNYYLIEYDYWLDIKLQF